MREQLYKAARITDVIWQGLLALCVVALLYHSMVGQTGDVEITFTNGVAYELFQFALKPALLYSAILVMSAFTLRTIGLKELSARLSPVRGGISAVLLVLFAVSLMLNVLFPGSSQYRYPLIQTEQGAK